MSTLQDHAPRSRHPAIVWLCAQGPLQSSHAIVQARGVASGIYRIRHVMERVWQRDYANHGQAMGDIGDYIISFYNSVPLHSKLGNLPPNAFEQHWAINQPIGLCEIT